MQSPHKLVLNIAFSFAPASVTLPTSTLNYAVVLVIRRGQTNSSEEQNNVRIALHLAQLLFKPLASYIIHAHAAHKYEDKQNIELLARASC